MSASSSISVEIWQTILRYAIGVADFLDPDSFEGAVAQHLIGDITSSKNDEATYWYSENTRNILQRVSISWNTYLRPFEHRFVRMLDVWHRDVDSEKLKKAIRVSFSRYNCRCRVYCSPLMSQPNGPVSFRSFCWTTLDELENMGMLIADMMQEEHWVEDLTPCLRHFYNVRTFIGPSCTYSGNLSRLLSKLPDVRHFYGKGYWGTREHSKPSKLVSENVVTLSLHSRKGANYRAVTWDLPRLRYLRLKDDSDEPLLDFIINAVMPLLQGIGSQLRALYIYHRIEGPQRDMPKELWDLSPLLETLRTGMSLTFPPPFFHPIHTLVLYDEKQVKQIAELPEWPNLRKIAFDIPWRWARDEMKSCSIDRANVRIEDRDGLTMQEYGGLNNGKVDTSYG